jgi:putative transposase
MKLFSRDRDYAAFEELLCEAHELYHVRLLSYCLMPNHWHLVPWPEQDGQLSRFMFWLTMTHVQRWRHARQLVGLGPLYQGRFKAFAMQDDHHFLTVSRYVERNAQRAKLVRRAEAWRWSSLAVRCGADSPCRAILHPWPVARPADYLELVNRAQTPAEVAALRSHVRTGRPMGDPAWQQRVTPLLGIPLHPRPRGRPGHNNGEK